MNKLLFTLACLTGMWMGLSLKAQSPAPLRAGDDTRCRQWVDSVMSRLDAHDKAAQLVIASLPASATSQAKKDMKEWGKKLHIGGLLFTGGVPEEQVMLTNLAQKSASLPLLVVYDREGGLSARFPNMPEFPANSALECIADPAQAEAYGRELAREYAVLGIRATLAPLPAGQWGEAFRRGLEQGGVLSIGGLDTRSTLSGASRSVIHTLEDGNDMVLVGRDLAAAIAQLQAAAADGTLGQELIDEKCRKVLAYKYRLSLCGTQPALQLSGASQRAASNEAQQQASDLRKSAVTVVSNYFNTLPLFLPEGADNGVALLSVGRAGADSAFAATLGEQFKLHRIQMPETPDAATAADIAGQLASYRRVVVSVTGEDAPNTATRTCLETLSVKAPVVYVFFSPLRVLQPLAETLSQANAVVLAHSAQDDLQQHVAQLLTARTTANGRLAKAVGRHFPAGTGVDIVRFMDPNKQLPEDFGLKSYALQQVDRLARKGVEEGAYPGCRLLIMKDGKTVYDRGFGTHSPQDTTSVRSTDMFDLAGLTSTTATVLAVMKLCDEGKVQLDAKVSTYLPALRSTDKRNITVRQLLLHEAGLPAYFRIYLDLIDPNSVHGPYSQSWEDQWHKTRISEHGYFCSDYRFKKGLLNTASNATYTLHMADGMWLNKSLKTTLWQKVVKSELGMNRYVYSDLGLMMLQQVVETVSKTTLDQYVKKEFYDPMLLKRTLFCPLDKYGKEEIMPTAFNDYLRRQDLCGYVQDETAACLGGVAGHAGLFSTAEELGKIYQMLLNGGELNGKRYLKEETCRLFLEGKSATGYRVLGFDRPDPAHPKSNPCSESTPVSVFGHTGFTGTSVWADPDNQLIIVFLTNRLCPDVWSTKLGDLRIGKDIQEAIYRSL